VLVISFVGATVSSAVASPTTPGRFRVESEIGVHIIDDRTQQRDVHCAFAGTTTQELVAGSGSTQLGTGRPQINYPRSRGPFRDATGAPILFECADVSVCFHPSTVGLGITGGLGLLLEVTLHVGSGLSFACDPASLLVSQTVHLGVQGEVGDCRLTPVTLTAHTHDRVTIGALCVWATYLGPE
jgi:hypothetical protein